MQEWTDSTVPITPANVFERKKKLIPVARVIPTQREVLLGSDETEEDKKLNLILSKVQEHQQSLREPGSGGER